MQKSKKKKKNDSKEYCSDDEYQIEYLKKAKSYLQRKDTYGNEIGSFKKGHKINIAGKNEVVIVENWKQFN